MGTEGSILADASNMIRQVMQRPTGKVNTTATFQLSEA